MRAPMPWLLACCLAAPCASATGLSVAVKDSHGQAVADAIVTVAPQDSGNRSPPAAGTAPTTRFIDQKDETFLPYIEIFHPGDRVVFRNSDKTRHHVYTFSPLKPFEFVLVPGQSSQPIELDKPGVIAVGCNIHDQMITFLFVSSAPWIAHTRSDGMANFAQLPAGEWTVQVWQPRLRPGKPDVSQPVSIRAADGQKSMTFSLNLLPDTRSDFDRERTRY